MTLGNKPSLGTEVSPRMVLTTGAATLVVLEAKFVRLGGAVGIGSHCVSVALLPSYLRVVKLVKGAG